MKLKAQIIDLLATNSNETLDGVLAEYKAIDQGDSVKYTTLHQLARELGISKRALNAFIIYTEKEMMLLH